MAATVGRRGGGRCRAGCTPRARCRGASHASSSARRYANGLNCTWLTTGATSADREQLLELGDAEVGDADRARVPALAGALHPRPRPGRPALRPVDDVEVDRLDARAARGSARASATGSRRRDELRRDEHLLARDAAVAQCPARRSARCRRPARCRYAGSRPRAPSAPRPRTRVPSGTCQTPSPSSGSCAPSARVVSLRSAATAPRHHVSTGPASAARASAAMSAFVFA